MLDACAPGHTWKEYPHNFCVMYNGLTFPSLPKYQHIQVGHVKKLAQVLKLEPECANRHFPGLIAPKDEGAK